MALSMNLGYPRIGRQRELKKATEAFWAGKIDESELQTTAKALRKLAWETQRTAGIDSIPSNDFSFYDGVLDTVALTGAVPPRYRWEGGDVDLKTYFAMARGSVEDDLPAMEMTKFFNSNYHFIVPELAPGMNFALGSRKPFEEYSEASRLGIETRPVLIGPVSFLLLGKTRDVEFDRLELLDSLVGVYLRVIEELNRLGVAWVQFDEPAFVQDRTDAELSALNRAYQTIAAHRGDVSIAVVTYFDRVGESYEALTSLPVQAVGLDFVHDGGANLRAVQSGFPSDKTLIAGVVDGRNIWINDYAKSLELLESLGVEQNRLAVAPSSSLMFVPIDLDQEDGLDPSLKTWLAFANQKLEEVEVLTTAIGGDRDSVAPRLEERAEALRRRSESNLIHRQTVKDRVGSISERDGSRGLPFEQRRDQQRRRLDLPIYPSTTIGSFPQTPELRRARRQAEKGDITAAEYDHILGDEIKRVINFQQEIDLDVLVHGEPERSDMVEYFGERMDGFAFTRHGWVQSYGSRYVRPPVIFGDVSRPHPMTVKWFSYAQGLTGRPVKGMLTGPVTILQWSFVRDDQLRSDTCLQIALALRDEVVDLESAGALVIQIDEPALREGLPLREVDWKSYLDWAIGAFRIAASGVRPDTQIHTHMCYSDFNSIIDSIQAMDADVVSIENSRSDLELLDVFKRVSYANEIGPGVFDIHSPRVPSVEEMVANLTAASSVLNVRQLWVNPDCGLKTRRWEEVDPSLRNMMAAAKELRAQVSVSA